MAEPREELRIKLQTAIEKYLDNKSIKTIHETRLTDLKQAGVDITEIVGMVIVVTLPEAKSVAEICQNLKALDWKSNAHKIEIGAMNWFKKNVGSWFKTPSEESKDQTILTSNRLEQTIKNAVAEFEEEHPRLQRQSAELDISSTNLQDTIYVESIEEKSFGSAPASTTAWPDKTIPATPCPSPFNPSGTKKPVLTVASRNRASDDELSPWNAVDVTVNKNDFNNKHTAPCGLRRRKFGNS